MSPKPGPKTCFCPFCHRRRIVVDKQTSKREHHFRKQGRKGGRCRGSELHINTRPEART